MQTITVTAEEYALALKLDGFRWASKLPVRNAIHNEPVFTRSVWDAIFAGQENKIGVWAATL